MATFLVHITVDDRDAPAVAQGFTAWGQDPQSFLQSAVAAAVHAYTGDKVRAVELIYDPTKDPHNPAYVDVRRG